MSDAPFNSRERGGGGKWNTLACCSLKSCQGGGQREAGFTKTTCAAAAAQEGEKLVMGREAESRGRGD